MAPNVEELTDPSEALGEATPLLVDDPVRTNSIGSSLTHAAKAGSTTSSWWIARSGGDIVGLARSPLPTASAAGDGVIVSDNRTATIALARAIDGSGVRLAAIDGEAATTAAFAAEWGSLSGCAATTVRATQLFELNRPITQQVDVHGRVTVRVAAETDVNLLCEWYAGFDRDTFDQGFDPEIVVRAKLGSIWLAVDGAEPTAMASATPSVNGVRRVNAVYTPPSGRRRGDGTRITAAVVAEIQRGGDRAALYTDLTNPGSNRLYRRLGFEPHSEFLRWAFDR